MNYYPFHIGDYLSATRHLSWEEDAAFRRLLDTYYTTEKPIPADMRAACRLVMAQTESQRESVRVVLEEFFTLTDAGWINKRADAEIAAMREKQQKQRDKANKRWAMPKAEHGNATASPTDATASKVDADAVPPTPTPTPTPIEIPSEAIASGAEAPAARDVVFALGVSLLTAAGVKESNGRSFLAMQCKTHGDKAVAAALEACAIARPVQPVPWIQEHLKPKASRTGKHTGFELKNYREGVTEDGHIA